MDVDDRPDDDDDAEKAFASIQKQIGLDQWTSSRLGSLPIGGGFQNNMNPEEWMEAEEEDDGPADIFMETIDEPPPSTTMKSSRNSMAYPTTPSATTTPLVVTRTPRRALQRANTPVIDNTSPHLHPNNNNSNINLASPWPQNQIILKSNPSLTMISSRSSHTEYKRYYDALVHFKRTSQDEVFLKTLNYACWERADDNTSSRSHQLSLLFKENSLKEGNFWRLLCCWHQLDPTTVLWDNSSATTTSSSHDRLLQDLAQQHMHVTPANLIATFWRHHAPLCLLRRRAILHWLETCFDHVLPADAQRRMVPNRRILLPNSSSKKNDSLRQALGIYETEHDAKIFRSALALILAGRLDDAKALAIDMDVAWRARLWSGGEPYGMTMMNTMQQDDDNDNDDSSSMTYESHGNPHRALWRSIMFGLAQDDSAKCDANLAAIHALLSSNFKRAIDNEALRTWDKALYAACKCSLDRTEDLLLHYQNNHRRTASPPYPGVEHLDKEREHLDATSDFSQMDEKTAIEIIKAAPFNSMHPDDIISDTICRFILGKHTLHGLLEESVRYLKEIEMAAEFEPLLRFVVHVAVYVDMKMGPNNEISTFKDELIVMYLNHLSTREDLWYMSVLYATFLPSHLILEKLPALLRDTENQNERKHIVGELQEFLPEETVVDILRATVELSFGETDEYADDFAPTETDKYKMRSIYWLCFEQGHMAEALIATNTLLRSFLLHGNKEESAMMLMDVSLPPDLEATVNTLQTEFSSSPLVENALLEFSSFSTYLDGMKQFAKWKKTTNECRSDQPNEMLALLDQNQLSDFEKNIARSQHNRNIVECKRGICQKVIKAATEAQRGLLEVLTHPGGLLSTMDDKMVDGEDQRVRRLELSELRLQLIPKTIQLYHNVCTRTATTLFDHLNEIAASIPENSSPVDALLEVDDVSSENDNTMSLLLNSSVSPLVWTQKALELMAKVQDDTTGLRTNLQSREYFLLLHKLQREAITMHEEYMLSMCATSEALP